MPEVSAEGHPLPGIVRSPDGRLYLHIQQEDAAEIIERLRETHVDAMGRAYLLRLDLLIERLGARWESKRDIVFSHLKTSFERKFQEPNWCIRIDDNGFLAAIVTLAEHKGALSAAELWYAASQFFVGDMSRTRPPLYEALADDVDRLRLIPIDLSKYFDRAEARSLGDEVKPPVAVGPGTARLAPQAVGIMRPMDRAIPDGQAGVVVGGRALRVACAVEPVFEMKKLAMIGHRFEPIVSDIVSNVAMDGRALAGLDWGDREQVDIANIEQGLKLLRMRSPDQRKMLMVVPAAFSTFASARSRSRVTALVSRGAQDMGLKVLFELRNLVGVPQSRVTEIVALLKPFCMAAMGHVSSDPKSITVLKGCGLAGACIDYDGGRRDDDALGAYLAALSGTARVSTGACMIQGFDNLHQMAVARLAGVTHASIKTSALRSLRN